MKNKWYIIFNEIIMVIHKHGEIKMLVRIMQLMKVFKLKYTKTTERIFLNMQDEEIDEQERATYDKLKEGISKEDEDYLKNSGKRAIEPFNEKTAPVRMKLWKRNFRNYKDRFNWNIQDVVTFKVSKI